MLRTLLGLLTAILALTLLASPGLSADDKKEHEAVVVQADKDSITVEIKGEKKTWKLEKEVKITDAKGNTTTIDVFKKGDKIKIVEQEGKVHELHHTTHGK